MQNIESILKKYSIKRTIISFGIAIISTIIMLLFFRETEPWKVILIALLLYSVTIIIVHRLLIKYVKDFMKPFTFLLNRVNKITISNVTDSLEVTENDFEEIEIIKKAINNLLVKIKTKDDEQTELQEKLIKSQKLELLGSLVGGVAHDFNNILTAIGGFTDLIKEEDDISDNIIEYTDELNKSVSRASALTMQLLSFSRKEETSKTEINLVELVENILKMLNRIIGEDITIQLSFSFKNICIFSNYNQIEQVFLNLIINAADALRGKFKVLTPTIKIELDIDYDKNGKYAVIIISDNGTGISTDILNNIFKPLFTTKTADKGTGIGLSTVNNIINENSGDIFVSTSKNGTVFTITFPLIEKQSIENLIDKKTDLKIDSKKILVVDDDTVICKIANKLLKKNGHSVILSDSGDEAYEKLVELDGDVDLIITDIVMPGVLNGAKLGELSLGKWPNIPIIYMSGYPNDKISELGISKEKDIYFLQKPFTKNSINEILAKVFK